MSHLWCVFHILWSVEATGCIQGQEASHRGGVAKERAVLEHEPPWPMSRSAGIACVTQDPVVTRWPWPVSVSICMVWESSCVVIVMLTPLSENGVRQCYHSWPDKDSNLYHVYQVLPQRTGAGGQAGVPRVPQSMDPQTLQTAVLWRPGLWHKF